MIVTLAEALATGRGTERPFSCPVHEDKHPSASVNVVKGVWFCYVCAAHGMLEDHVPTADEAIAVLSGARTARVRSEQWLDLFDADYSSPYWVRRVGFEVASANRCGTDPMTGAPTYPIRDEEGRVLGVVTRHDDDTPKYRYPFGVSTSRILYGAVRPVDVLVLVEGAGDVMAIQQASPPPSWGVAGVYGAGLHFPQIGLVARMAPKVVITAFDADMAGIAANLRARSQLDDIAPVLSHPWATFGGKDAAEVPCRDRVASLVTTLTDGGYGRHC